VVREVARDDGEGVLAVGVQRGLLIRPPEVAERAHAQVAERAREPRAHIATLMQTSPDEEGHEVGEAVGGSQQPTHPAGVRHP